MQTRGGNGRSVRFGVFEANLLTGELSKHGIRVRLQDQPFQVLAALVEKQGEVVTREELRLRIWPADTFVDFDNSLNTAVNKLREALGDCASNPRFVETLPRRGYRFLTPVEGDLSPHPPSASDPPLAVGRHWAALTLVTAALSSAALLAIWHGRSSAASASRNSVLIADFMNKTGDPDLDDSIRQGLAMELGDSPYMNVVSDAQVRQTLVNMGRAPEEHLNLDLAREVCTRENARALVVGEIAPLGSSFVLTIDSLNCATGETLSRDQVSANRKEDVLNSLCKLSQHLRTKLGESLASVQQFDVHIQDVTTSSLEALKAYSLGVRQRGLGGHDLAARPYFLHAITLDPNFAMAYAQLGVIYSNLGEEEKSAEYAKKAYDLRGLAHGAEGLYVISNYQFSVTGDLEQAAATLELWRQTYPQQLVPLINLGVAYLSMGKFEKAEEFSRQALAIQPGEHISLCALALEELALGRSQEARSLREKLAAETDDSDANTFLFKIAFLQGDSAAITRQLDWARSHPRSFDFLRTEAEVAAFSGKWTEAQKLFDQAQISAETDKFSGAAARVVAERSLWAAELGDTREARRSAAAAVAHPGAQRSIVLAAAALARAGDAPRAQSLMDQLTKRYPASTLITKAWLPAIRAQIETARGNPERAIELLAPAALYEMSPELDFYPLLSRGEAFLANGQTKDAVAQFQNIINHRGVAPSSPLYPLAFLGLARANSLAGDAAASKKAYEALFAFWKDADPDLPVLQQAKAEYAKLN